MYVTYEKEKKFVAYDQWEAATIKPQGEVSGEPNWMKFLFPDSKLLSTIVLGNYTGFVINTQTYQGQTE